MNMVWARLQGLPRGGGGLYWPVKLMSGGSTAGATAPCNYEQLSFELLCNIPILKVNFRRFCIIKFEYDLI